MKIAFCYSTKDRVDFTKKTLPAVITEADKFDLYIVDGSQTERGKNCAFDLAGHSKVKGVHANVTGGADVAIVFALSFMLGAGYDYLGLIENDVVLEEGWFDRIFALFARGAQDGYLVGSVSARCYSDRILIPRGDYAVMANIGAGMVLFSRAGAEAVLDYYRTGSLDEYKFYPSFFWEAEAPTPHEASDPSQKYNMSADWFFESSMMSRGMAALACAPTMAHCLDVPGERLQKESTEIAKASAKYRSDPVAFGNYDPCLRAFIAQPHHFLWAFSGDRKLIWAKHFGPFGMHVVKGQLCFSVVGNEISLLIRPEQACTISVAIDGAIPQEFQCAEGFGWRAIPLGNLKQAHELCFTFSSPVTVMAAAFPVPQRWFKNGYGLRHNGLVMGLE